MDELDLLKKQIEVRETLCLWDENYRFRIHKPGIGLLGFTEYRSRYNHAIVISLYTMARHVRDLRAWKQIQTGLDDPMDETWLCVVMDKVEPVLSEAVNLALVVKDQYVRGAVVLSLLAEQPLGLESEVTKMIERRNTPWPQKFEELETKSYSGYPELKDCIDDLWQGKEGVLLRGIHGRRQHDVPDYVDISLPDVWRMEDGVIAYGYSERVDLGDVAEVLSVQLNKLARAYFTYEAYCNELLNLAIKNCPYLDAP